MGVPRLPLIVLPHPVADLLPEELAEMARKTYPHVVAALTREGLNSADFFVEYERPERRSSADHCSVCVE